MCLLDYYGSDRILLCGSGISSIWLKVNCMISIVISVMGKISRGFVWVSVSMVVISIRLVRVKFMWFSISI